ncbi:MAG: hypothetical protein H6553_11285 [Chitinophagales bacterium]|nr:hypothetical protein [Chitinophagales bacterium]
MNFQIWQHIHLTFVVLFLLSYTVKSVLFLTGNASYANFKKKTIVVETIFSVIFLVSGIYMLIQRITSETYSHMLDPKITMALLAIPLGIIGFKKNNKILVALSLLMFYLALVIGLIYYLK